MCLKINLSILLDSLVCDSQILCLFVACPLVEDSSTYVCVSTHRMCMYLYLECHLAIWNHDLLISTVDRPGWCSVADRKIFSFLETQLKPLLLDCCKERCSFSKLNAAISLFYFNWRVKKTKQRDKQFLVWDISLALLYQDTRRLRS